MNENRSSGFTEQELAIRKILMEEWDPIGVADYPESQNEYDKYISGIAEMIEGKTTQQAMAAHLWNIQTEVFGMFREQFRAERAADLLSKMGNA